MKFLTCAARGQVFPCVLSKDQTRAVPLSLCGLDFPTLEDLARFSSKEDLEKIDRYLVQNPGAGESLDAVTLLPAIPEPFQEIIIMENNFVADGAALPTYFYKKATLATASGSVVPSYPGHVTELDYQAELCAVVWGDVFQVHPDKAKNRIFGYTLINNIIARNLTLRHRRPYIATSLDGFLPMCSYIVTPDALDMPVEIRSYVNGELRQRGDLRDVKFSAEYAVADLSRVSVVRGGSIISLSTPHGAGIDQTPPVYLKSGDVVTCEADGVGTLTSVIG